MRFEKLHGQVDFSCRNFSSNMAISAVQICTCAAFSLVPTNVLILRCCLKGLKEEFDLLAFLVDGGEVREVKCMRWVGR